jgi:hypothetical protein
MLPESTALFEIPNSTDTEENLFVAFFSKVCDRVLLNGIRNQQKPSSTNSGSKKVYGVNSLLSKGFPHRIQGGRAPHV